jgi:methyl-accepting chemotaxis protein
MNLRQLRIGTRLALGFGVIVVAMLAVNIGGTLLTRQSRDDLARVLEAANAKENLAASMKANFLQEASVIRGIALHSDLKGMQAEEDHARKLSKEYDALAEKMLKLNLAPAEKQIVEALLDHDKRMEGPLQQAMGLATSFRGEEAAKVIMTEIDPLMQKSLGELDKLIELQKKANRDAISAATATGDRLGFAVLVAMALMTAGAILVAWLTSRSITRPLGESVTVVKRVASGNLASRIEVVGRDEPAEVLRALRDMNDGLANMVRQIRSGAESIAVGAGQVAAGNQQLSSRTEEHASSLEETASTLEEFTTTVKQNAEHARNASELAGKASVTAEKGGEVVGKVVQTMQEVTASSKKISDIIAVIDGISFQTNILALNAAVEAARAGEQGRGFAVVASEVRSLAQRSAASAKEIRGLIEESVGRVEAGAKLVENAGRTMEELVTSVRRVAQIMTEIAAASHEQSSGIEQINKAITQMDHVVQMNASVVEEATAAATSMAHQATALARSVAQFQLADEPQAAPAKGSRGATAAAVDAPLSRPLAVERKQALPATGREPVLAQAHDEDWKEF